MQVGIGLTISPCIGALLYDIFGYKAPFFFFGTLFAIISAFIRHFIPEEVDSNEQERVTFLELRGDQGNGINQIEQPLRFREVMSNPKIFFGCFCSCFAYFVYS
jgi:MFS family permease